jgi:hypothetical protein
MGKAENGEDAVISTQPEVSGRNTVEPGICPACEEPVDEGYSFVQTDQVTDPSTVLNLETLDQAMSSGAYHQQCAKMTLRFCPHFRDGLQDGSVGLVAYKK